MNRYRRVADLCREPPVRLLIVLRAGIRVRHSRRGAASRHARLHERHHKPAECLSSAMGAVWLSSGRCRWALIYLAFGTLTSINNFAAVTASKAGKEGTLKKIKKCLDSDALPDAVGDCD